MLGLDTKESWREIELPHTFSSGRNQESEWNFQLIKVPNLIWKEKATELADVPLPSMEPEKEIDRL